MESYLKVTLSFITQAPEDPVFSCRDDLPACCVLAKRLDYPDCDRRRRLAVSEQCHSSTAANGPGAIGNRPDRRDISWTETASDSRGKLKQSLGEYGHREYQTGISALTSVLLKKSLLAWTRIRAYN